MAAVDFPLYHCSLNVAAKLDSFKYHVVEQILRILQKARMPCICNKHNKLKHCKFITLVQEPDALETSRQEESRSGLAVENKFVSWPIKRAQTICSFSV